MALLSADRLVKSFGVRTLFSIPHLELHPGDRIGLVGANGAGKSTLLDLLYGTEPADQGQIDRRCPIAMIRQSGEPEGESDALHAKQLAVADSACMSGGERTRRAIACALSQAAPLLFADEPTTNLDLDGVAFVERALMDYPGAVLLISHDRALLDALCTTIWELADRELRIFPGSYTDWTVQKQRERDFAQFAYDQSRAEKRRLLSEAQSLSEQARSLRKAPKRMGNSEARLHKGFRTVPQGKLAARSATMLRRAHAVKEKPRPTELPTVKMALGAASPITSKIAARLSHLSVRYGTRTILSDCSFTLATGKRTVMLGPNGAGKTTAISQLLTPNHPCASLANGVRIGYFAQNHDLLDPNKTVLENVRADSSLPAHEVRTILANLMLPGDDVHKPAGVLSGGERAKAAFARLLASDCNLLILDEPTNHIDLYTAEALEQLLLGWQGTLLVITHDRYLVEKLAERLLFVENGSIRTFEGSWADWQNASNRHTAPKQDDASNLLAQLSRLEDLYK